MNNNILVSVIAFLNLPSWLIGIFVFCVLYPFWAAFANWNWPFERTPTWEELIRRAEREANYISEMKDEALRQAQPQTAIPIENMIEPEPEPELEPEPQTDPQLIEEAIGCICYIGFKKTEAKQVVNRVCNNHVFTNVEELIKAALDRSNV